MFYVRVCFCDTVNTCIPGVPGMYLVFKYVNLLLCVHTLCYCCCCCCWSLYICLLPPAARGVSKETLAPMHPRSPGFQSLELDVLSEQKKNIAILTRCVKKTAFGWFVLTEVRRRLVRGSSQQLVFLSRLIPRRFSTEPYTSTKRCSSGRNRSKFGVCPK